MAADDVIREYHESYDAYHRRHAEELSALDHIRDRDVRAAKATLAVPAEIRDRLLAATIALDAHKDVLEERWIAAHEDLAILRRGGIAR
jgi:hypothetical protein